MAKIRHIAYRAEDVDAMAKFFVDAMGMKMIQKRKNNAIDLSDGLSLDLYRLTRECRAGAEVEAALVPRHAAASFDQALHGGEDYELLFTLPAGRRPPAGVTRVGRIVPGRRLILIGAGGRRSPLPVRGFQHNL